jgi:hypothetical protein
MDLTVLKPKDHDAVLAFERNRAESSIQDPIERELASWKARWRPEQLTHYLNLGWSFGAWENEQLRGYVLAQPLLFFRGLTQSLWIETMTFETKEIGEALLESIYRWARDKHFQTVLISELPEELQPPRTTEVMKDRILEMSSSRMV